jgi:hypothetical protein
MDKEILERMPEWYRILMQAVSEHQSNENDSSYQEKQEVLYHD